MAPVEINRYLSEVDKGYTERSWMAALLQRMPGKKFPKTPAELWRKETPKTLDNQLVAIAKALKSQQDRAERLAKRGKRAEDITYMREE